MIDGILGTKVGMTQLFNEDGRVTPVTVIEAGPCVVVQRKTVEKDGYSAVQVGLVDAGSAKRANKPMRGHHEKAGVPPTRVRRDPDGDWLSTRRERRHLGTDPRSRDTDGDGLHDGREVRRLKTDPTRADTDGDGMNDRREVRRERDPLRWG